MEADALLNTDVWLSEDPNVEVKRSKVFCSRLIQQRPNRRVRYQQSPVFVRILRHCFPDLAIPSADGTYPRPTSSPFPCFQCHRRFEGAPVFMPMYKLSGTREEWGNFCDATCLFTYILYNMNDHNVASLVADVTDYLRDVFGFEGPIQYAPHFSEHERYGGPMTDDQFDRVAKTPGLRTNLRMAPYIPTQVVVEWSYTAGDGAAAVGTHAEAAATQTSQPPPPPAATPDQVLADAMKMPASENDHQRWDVRHIRQPPLAEIEKRLASLEPPPKTTGLYELFLERKGGFETATPPAEPAKTKKTAVAKPASNPRPAGRGLEHVKPRNKRAAAQPPPAT